MAVLELFNLTKKFGDFTAVDNISLSVDDGEIVALLGESGCGKSTTLRMISGFTQPNGGRIMLDGRELNPIPAYKRNVGIFFQNYALFPHLTAFDNVAFGLKLKKLSKTEIQERAENILSLVKLIGLEKRYPKELSGGQQQRVALARALVTEPSVLLLDEPLSNLDAKLRAEMQVEIKRIQRKLKITTIIVTHDQEEAVSLADRVIIMKEGRILQTGRPQEVFLRPATPFVADFMGFSNFINGVLVKDESNLWVIDCNGVQLLADKQEEDSFCLGQELCVAIRPESIALSQPDEKGAFKGRITSSTYKGNTTRLEIDGVIDGPLYVQVHDYTGADSGNVWVLFPPGKIRVYQRG